MIKCLKYTNRNIWVDPRCILSKRMSEGTVVFKGIKRYGYDCSFRFNYIIIKIIHNVNYFIKTHEKNNILISIKLADYERQKN